MVTLMCKGGILDGKLVSQPSDIYEFTVENYDTLRIEKYIRHTEPDGFGGHIVEWILKTAETALND